MQRVRRVVGMMGLAMALAAPALAQESGTVTIQATGGGVHGLANLDPKFVCEKLLPYLRNSNPQSICACLSARITASNIGPR